MSADRSAHPAADAIDTRLVRTIVRLTATIGGPLFLVTVILHPARDGHDIAAHAGWYAFTHSMEAISLLIQAICLAGALALGMGGLRARGLAAWFTALAGTVLWFGLIVYDGGHNPVTARYAPDLVHTSGDLDIEGGIIVLAANVLFPYGYAAVSADQEPFLRSLLTDEVEWVQLQPAGVEDWFTLGLVDDRPLSTA